MPYIVAIDAYANIKRSVKKIYQMFKRKGGGGGGGQNVMNNDLKMQDSYIRVP